MNEQKKLYIRFMKHLCEKHGVVYGLLDKLSNDEREKERGSYYKNLSGLFVHSLGGLFFFKTLFDSSLSGESKAKAALGALNGVKIKEKDLSGEDWKALKASSEKICGAYVEFAGLLTEAELAAPVKAPFFDKPLPVSFLLEEMVMHTAHHFGQISQVLDEMKIDNDFSSISPALFV